VQRCLQSLHGPWFVALRIMAREAQLRFSSAHTAKRATVAATRTYSSGASGIDWWRHHYSLPVVNRP